MKKLFILGFLFSASTALFSQSSMRSDEMSLPEIDNLSGAKPDGDDLAPESGVTSYSTNGENPLIMDKPDDGDNFHPVKGDVGQIQQADLTTATVYPNPANDFIFVSTEATTGYIRIMNLLGQEMFMVDITSTENYINIASLNEGIYFISIESGAQKVVKKIKVLK
jgi:hypothetical protein